MTMPWSTCNCTRVLLVLLSLAGCLAAAARETDAAAAPLSAAFPLDPTLPGRSAATCWLDIRGTPTGSISKASMRCYGRNTPVTMGVDDLLGGFMARSKGVVTDDRCGVLGCLLTFCGSTRAIITDSSISGVDSKRIQAVVCTTNTIDLTLQGTSVTNNNATALVAFDQSRVVIAASRLAHNTGYYFNGGATAADESVLVITNQSSVSGNVAYNTSGAGVRVQDNAQVWISGGTKVDNNTSSEWSGGGVAVSHEAQLVITGGSRVCNNMGKHGGGLVVWDSARVVINGSSKVCNNTSENGTGGGVAVRDDAELTITGGSSVCNNTGGGGGGMAVWHKAQVIINGSSKVCNNTSVNSAGGGVVVFDYGQLTITGGSSLCNNNVKTGGGGGVAIGDKARFTVDGGSQVCNNTCSDGPGGGVAVQGEAQLSITGGSSLCNNTCDSRGGGVIMVNKTSGSIDASSKVCNNTSLGSHGGGVSISEDVQLTISGGSSVCGNKATLGGGGLSVLGRARLAVHDSSICNNTCTANKNLGGGGLSISYNATVFITGTSKLINNWVDDFGSGGAAVVSGNASLNLGEGVVVEDNGMTGASVGTNIAIYENTTLAIGPNVTGSGQFLTKCDQSVYLGRLPGQCQEGEYEASYSLCQCCPEYQYGFEAEAQACYPCPQHAVCPGGDVVMPVSGYYHSSKRSVQMHRCPMRTSCLANGTCAKGYTGNLCGACAAGFGQTVPLKCGECMAPAQQFGVYVVIVSITVVFITITVHFTWQDNKASDKSVRPSDIIKVLVQFLQYMVILGSISVPWPDFLTRLFSSATVVYGGASGQALSLDCWLSSWLHSAHVPLAIQRQLTTLLVAAGIILAAMLLISVKHTVQLVMPSAAHTRGRGLRSHAWRLWCKLRVAFLVVAFYAYPTFVKVGLSFFACLPIDDEHQQPYPQYAVLNHPAGYWVLEVQQECFSGWHKAWALGFGLPATVILCFGVPLGLCLFLWFSKAKAASAAFREHYGFLYRNYTDSRVWWEAVWAAQTVLLTAVSVFHFTIQAYYAVFAMCMLLLLSAAVQQLARPYAQKELHQLHFTSTACLFINAWLSFAFFDNAVDAKKETLVPLHTTIAATLVAIDSAFVLWCLYKIVMAAAVRKWVLNAFHVSRIIITKHYMTFHCIICHAAGYVVKRHP